MRITIKQYILESPAVLGGALKGFVEDYRSIGFYVIRRRLALIVTAIIGYSGRTRLSNSINRPLTIINLPFRINHLFMEIYNGGDGQS